MKLAIMQPYLFPYLGYFQLMHAADKFVLYDDVNFIKGGWINRNRILVNGAATLFTLPLSNASPFAKINDIKVDGRHMHPWRSKFLKTLELAYKKAPFFNAVFPLVAEAVALDEAVISRFIYRSLTIINAYLGLNPKIAFASDGYSNQHLSGQQRILDICNIEGARAYLNAIGGTLLYDKTVFAQHGLTLHFVKPCLSPYRQFNQAFVPNLSVLDVMMFNSVEQIKLLLNQYELV